MGYIDSDGEYTGDKTLAGEGKAVSKSALNDKISHLLHNALTIMDEHGRGIPGGSYALWDDAWDDLRRCIFEAYEIGLAKRDDVE